MKWIAVAAALVVTAGCSSSGGEASVPAPSKTVGTKLEAAMSKSVLDLPFVDARGRKTSLAAFKGKTIVLSDSMTLCQETCPLDTANLVQTARRVEKAGLGKKVVFLTITVDPERDTPEQLAAYRKLYRDAPANWRLLTGSKKDLDRLWKYLGVWFQKVPEDSPPARSWRTGKKLTYDVNHADEVFFLDGKGRERFVMSGAGDVQKGTDMPKAMRSFLNEDGKKNLEHPQAGSWTVPEALDVVGWLTQHRFGGTA